MSRRGETEDGLGWGGLVASKAEMRAEREHDAEVARLRAELERLREELACVRQALPEMWRDSVPSVAVATLAAENNALQREAHTWSKAAEHYAKPLQPLTREQIDAVMTEHYPLSSLLREEVDAFEACVRDLERLHGIGG